MSFTHSFSPAVFTVSIHSFNNYLMNTYSMPGTRDIAVNKTDKVSAFRKLPSGRRGIISKKTYNVESTMKKKKLSKVLERGWWGGRMVRRASLRKGHLSSKNRRAGKQQQPREPEESVQRSEAEESLC